MMRRKLVPRSQLGDLPDNLYPEHVEDAYGAAPGVGYSTNQVFETQRFVDERRIEQAEAEAVAGSNMTQNVANRGRFAQSAFSVTDRAVQILPVNPNRIYFIIQNLGTLDVYINFGNKAQLNNIRIVGGGNYEPYVTPLDSVSVICSTGEVSAVAVIEGVEIRSQF